MGEYYARDGREITQAEWLTSHNDKRVAKDTVVCGDQEVDVSTVWLGLNHAWGVGPPLIFETMVFGGPPHIHNWCERYSTEAAAKAGHEKVVAALRAADLTMFGSEL